MFLNSIPTEVFYFFPQGTLKEKTVENLEKYVVKDVGVSLFFISFNDCVAVFHWLLQDKCSRTNSTVCIIFYI